MYACVCSLVCVCMCVGVFVTRVCLCACARVCLSVGPCVRVSLSHLVGCMPFIVVLFLVRFHVGCSCRSDWWKTAALYEGVDEV